MKLIPKANQGQHEPTCIWKAPASICQQQVQPDFLWETEGQHCWVRRNLQVLC